MAKYQVRVTREPDGETADFDVEAASWEDAKENAIREAKRFPEAFDTPPPPKFVIDPMDDDEEAARIE